jgi:nucleotide-binding universal stress UspA family protein
MFKKIVVAVDGSAHANQAVDCAADFAKTYGAELILLHVAQSTGPARIPPELRDYARIERIDAIEADLLTRVAEEILQAAEIRARGQGAKQVRTSVGVGDPAQAIVAAAKAEEADLIVMGRRGLGSATGLLMGSVSHKVAHLAECACMTVV